MRKTFRFLVVVTCLIVAGWGHGTSFAETVLVVKSKNIGPYNQAVEGFQQAYQGETVHFSLDEQPEIPREMKADIAVAVGSKALDAALELPKNIPIIILMNLKVDPGDLSGRSYVGIVPMVSLDGYLTFIGEHFPSLSPVGIITSDEVIESEGKSYPGPLKLRVERVEKRQQVPGVAEKLMKEIGCLLVLPDPVVLSKETYDFLLLKSFEMELPIITYSRALVKGGALIGLAASYQDMGAQAAGLAGKGAPYLRGKKEMISPETVTIYLNRLTRETFGIKVPEEVAKKVEIVE